MKSVELAVRADPAYSYTGLGVSVIPPACAATVVLLTGRFEEFLKQAVEGAFTHYSRAVPPVDRNRLTVDLQLKIIKDNLTGAAREKIRGRKRTVAERITNLEDIANKIVRGSLWGGDAIDTAGNPNAETVRSLLNLLGISNPWQKIEHEFAKKWMQRCSADPSYKSVPSAAKELDSILVWRNAVAHSSASSLAIGLRDLNDALGYIEDLASSIDDLISAEVDAMISTCGSSPAVWL